jgi:hypothetical protein
MTVSTGGLLSNDGMQNGQFTAVLVDPPTAGMLSLNGDGTFTYTPNDGAAFTGSDTFTYQLDDGLGMTSNVASVTIATQVALPINLPWAVASPDSYTFDAATTMSISQGGLLSNDSTNDGQFTATLVDAPTYGTVSLNGDGTFTYTPTAGSAFVGDDLFTYRLVDSLGTISDTVATTIHVNAPSPPLPAWAVANPDVYAFEQAETMAVTLEGVLANDDFSGGPFTAALVDAPTYGTVSLNGDGTFTYSPAAGADFVGSDQFTYQLDDGLGTNSNVVSVMIYVNPPPTPWAVAESDTYRFLPAAEITVFTDGVMANDSISDGPFTAALVDAPQHGTVVLNGDGTFSYTPTTGADFRGGDAFTYQLSDGAGTLSNLGIVIILLDPNATGGGRTAAARRPPRSANATASALPRSAKSCLPTSPNAPPWVTADPMTGYSYSVAQGGTLTVPGYPNPMSLVYNDGDDHTSQFELQTILEPNSGPGQGTLTLNANGGGFTYRANDNAVVGNDSFQYRAKDCEGALSSNAALVTITITASTTKPVVSITGVGTISEIDAGKVLTVSRGTNTSASLTVNFGLSGTATYGSDYTLSGATFSSGQWTVTIPAGQSSTTFTVQPVWDDVSPEVNETVVVTLGSNSTAVYTVSSTLSKTTVTITDVPKPTISLRDADTSAREGTSPIDWGSIRFKVSSTTPKPITVDFVTTWTPTQWVAAFPADFDYPCACVIYYPLPHFPVQKLSYTIPAGTTPLQDIDVALRAKLDGLIEGKETATFTLINGTGYKTSSTQKTAKVDIADADDIPTVTIAATDGSASEPGRGHGTGTFTFRRSALDISEELRVYYTIDTSAPTPAATPPGLPGADYSGTGPANTVNMLIIPKNQPTGDIIITGLADRLFGEPPEYIRLRLFAHPSYVIGASSYADMLLYDNTARVSLTVTDSVAGEPGHSAGTAKFKIERFAPAYGNELVVGYWTEQNNGVTIFNAATPGVDYTGTGTAVTLAPNVPSMEITITPLADSLLGLAPSTWPSNQPTPPGYEHAGEAILLRLLEGEGYVPASTALQQITLLDNTGTLTITADSALGGDAKAGEPGHPDGTGTFKVVRSGGDPSKAVTASYWSDEAYGNSARMGLDFAPLPMSVSFAANGPNPNVAYVTITGLADSLLGTEAAPRPGVEEYKREAVILELFDAPGYSAVVPTIYRTPIPYRSRAMVTLHDNTATVWMAPTDTEATEGAANVPPGPARDALTGSVRFHRSGPYLANPLTVNFSTSGTATYGLTGSGDYGFTNATTDTSMTIPADASFVDLVIAPRHDNLVEGDETATINLTGGTGYVTTQPTSASVTIHDATERTYSTTIDVDLDGDGVPDTVPSDEELFLGVNNDDDNDDGIADLNNSGPLSFSDDELLPVRLTIVSNGSLTGHVLGANGVGVRVWSDAIKSAEVSTASPLELNSGGSQTAVVKVYVEGLSEGEGVVTFTLVQQSEAAGNAANGPAERIVGELSFTMLNPLRTAWITRIRKEKLKHRDYLYYEPSGMKTFFAVLETQARSLNFGPQLNPFGPQAAYSPVLDMVLVNKIVQTDPLTAVHETVHAVDDKNDWYLDAWTTDAELEKAEALAYAVEAILENTFQLRDFEDRLRKGQLNSANTLEEWKGALAEVNTILQKGIFVNSNNPRRNVNATDLADVKVKLGLSLNFAILMPIYQQLVMQKGINVTLAMDVDSVHLAQPFRGN